MGREVRRVPPNWSHPEIETLYGKRLQPMYDENFADAAKEWKEKFAKWEAGERPGYIIERNVEFWEYEGNPPEREFYRPWKDAEATWFQVWETVSEGTPVTPPFETEEELITYLAANGDFWDQKRGDGPWDLGAAREFVKSGWAPSAVMVESAIYRPRDGAPKCDE